MPSTDKWRTQSESESQEQEDTELEERYNFRPRPPVNFSEKKARGCKKIKLHTGRSEMSEEPAQPVKSCKLQE